jgi:tripartite motif-containing protein 62
MEKAILVALDNLKKSITCAICLEFYHQPISLSCQHSFCEKCFREAQQVKNICPICSKPVKNRSLIAEEKASLLVPFVSAFLSSKIILDAASVGIASTKCLPDPTASNKKAKHTNDEQIRFLMPADQPVIKPIFLDGALVDVVARTWIG